MITNNPISNVWRIALGAGLFCGVQGASALCSDGRHPSVKAELESSSIVVVAKVTGSHSQSSQDDPEGIRSTIYHLVITRAFKNVGPKDLSITSENTSGRLPMDVGKSYLLFVNRYANVNIVDSCGNSGLLDDRSDEINILDSANSATTGKPQARADHQADSAAIPATVYAGA